jgi:phosphomannomutase
MDPELLTRANEWRAADPDEATAAELQRLIDAGDERELRERLGSSLEFGTAGLRGVVGAGSNRMNRAVVRRTTAGLARYLLEQFPDAAERGVVVGRDGRRMSLEFAREAAQVLCAHGIRAHVFPDLVPTPVTAFATRELGAVAGVVITASHNPPEYNGYKVYWGNGAQIIPPHDAGIAAAIEAVGPARDVPLADVQESKTSGRWQTLGPEMGAAYLAAVLAERRHPRPAPDLSIVYTAMHGVGGSWVEDAFLQAGLVGLKKVHAQHDPDGSFPTVRFPNPEEPGAMDLAMALAEEEKADLILANDPDADRLAVGAREADGRMRMLTGNEVGVLLGHYVLTQSGKGDPGRPPLVVTTIVSSPQLGGMARDLGAQYGETLTGFKWIANHGLVQEARGAARFVFGYEEALGYTVGASVRDKDGVNAAVVFADLAAWCHGRGSSVLGYLEEIQRAHGLYVATQANFTFPGAQGAKVISGIMEGFRTSPPGGIGGLGVTAAHDYLPGARGLPPSNVIAYELEGGSRVTLRPSGTEPKIKYYVDLREPLATGEAMAVARARAEQKLTALVEALVQLARARGQPPDPRTV